MNVPPRIEPLESRIAPATFTAALAGGVLTINPSAADAPFVIDIVQTGARAFEVSDVTDLNHFVGVLAIRVAGSTGADDISVTIGNAPEFRGNIAVNGAGGADAVELRLEGNLRGNFSAATMGADAQISLAGAGRLRGHASLTGSDASASLHLDAAMRSISTSGLGQIEIQPRAAVFGDALFAAGSAGFMEFTDLPGSSALARFHDNLTIIGGAGADYIELYSAVRGAVKILTAAGEDQIVMEGGTIGGPLRIDGGADADTLLFERSAFFCGVGIDLGAGDDRAVFESNNTTGHFRLFGDAGNDDFDFERGLFRKRVTLDFGGGNNHVDFEDDAFSAGLSISGNSGNDSVAGEAIAVFGSTRFSLGEGSNVVHFKSSGFTGTVQVLGGSGDDRVGLVESTRVTGLLTVDLRNGSNSLLIGEDDGPGHLDRGLRYLGGAGADSVVFYSGSMYGRAEIFAGDGANEFRTEGFMQLNPISLSYHGGAGIDDVILRNGGAGLVDIGVFLGRGNDVLTVENGPYRGLFFTAGSVTAVGGEGTDRLLKSPLIEPTEFTDSGFEVLV